MGETGLLFSKSSLHNGLKYKTRDHGESGPAFGGGGEQKAPTACTPALLLHTPQCCSQGTPQASELQGQLH